MESKARLSGRCHSGRTILDVVASRRQFLIATAGGAAAVSLPIVAVAAESVVFEGTNTVEDPGHTVSKLKKSIEPKPDASSKPVVAGYSEVPAVEQYVVPAVH